MREALLTNAAKDTEPPSPNEVDRRVHVARDEALQAVSRLEARQGTQPSQGVTEKQIKTKPQNIVNQTVYLTGREEKEKTLVIPELTSETGSPKFSEPKKTEPKLLPGSNKQLVTALRRRCDSSGRTKCFGR